MLEMLDLLTQPTLRNFRDEKVESAKNAIESFAWIRAQGTRINTHADGPRQKYEKRRFQKKVPKYCDVCM